MTHWEAVLRARRALSDAVRTGADVSEELVALVWDCYHRANSAMWAGRADETLFRLTFAVGRLCERARAFRERDLGDDRLEARRLLRRALERLDPVADAVEAERRREEEAELLGCE